MSKPYVRRGGLIDVQPPPWESESGRGYMFTVAGDSVKLSALCNRVLVDASGNRLKLQPAGDGILVTVQEIRGFHSTAVPASEAIRYNYNELTFWVCVTDDQGNLAFVLPYVFHDNGVPTAVGRELFGFSKELAVVTMAADGSSFDISALAGDGAGAARWQPIVRIERTVQAAEALNTALSLNLFEAANRDWIKKSGSAFALSTFTNLQFNLIFLRQFGSPQGVDCDVREHVTVPLTVVQGELPTQQDRYRMSFPSVSGAAIADALGIVLDANGACDLEVVAKANFSFKLDPATSVLN